MKKAFIFGDKTLDEAVKRVNSLRKIAVIGAGTMGQGIAIDLLRRTECEVVLLDVSKDALDKAIARLESGWAREVKGAMIRQEDADQFRGRVSCIDSYDDLADCDVIWEVATEDANIKAKIFASIEAVADSDKMAAIFSNTSSHTTEELAELFTKASFREKFLTVHGYFPFEGNRLIDVMKGKYASMEAFRFGVVFADQILEKKVVALEVDHHGYLTDPIFQGMGAIVSWDVKTGDDIVQLGGLWELFTANPFSVLDHTGHMPYTESSKHLGQALPEDDRLRSLYIRDGLHYPTWIGELELAGHTGANSKDRKGFYQLNEKRRPEGVFDPASGKYVPIGEISRDDYWSFFEAANMDRAAGKIKSADGLVHVACSDDNGGKAFRKYALPICLYCMDMVQDGFATAGQVNTCTRAGLRFKVGIIELVDALIRNLGIDGLLDLIKRARDENADDQYAAEMLDTDGTSGPRKGKPCLLHAMRKKGITQLLGYGKYYGTTVSETNLATGEQDVNYLDLKLCQPNGKDRVASIIFNNPMRGNVFNKAVIDQLNDAWTRVLAWHKDGKCGGVLVTAAGDGMKMFGADAKEFNRGWFDAETGYVPLSEEDAAASSKNAVELFRQIQRSPVATVGVFGEKWGGGCEFTYFLDQRFDVRAHGFVWDALDRTSVWQQKNTYNQPELDYAILPGFAAAGELKRLGVGDSIAIEVFDQGMTADRAYQVSLSNGVFDCELEALRRGYELARQMAKDAPYSRALFKKQLERGIDDEALAHETGEVFNPNKNPYIRSGLIKLLDRRARPPKMDYSTHGVNLPGFEYPKEEK